MACFFYMRGGRINLCLVWRCSDTTLPTPCYGAVKGIRFFV
jgi:hypothetical protein